MEKLKTLIARHIILIKVLKLNVRLTRTSLVTFHAVPSSFVRENRLSKACTEKKIRFQLSRKKDVAYTVSLHSGPFLDLGQIVLFMHVYKIYILYIYMLQGHEANVWKHSFSHCRFAQRREESEHNKRELIDVAENSWVLRSPHGTVWIFLRDLRRGGGYTTGQFVTRST